MALAGHLTRLGQLMRPAVMRTPSTQVRMWGGQRDHNVLGGIRAFFLSRPDAVITTKFLVPGSTRISSPNPPPVREARGKTA